MSETSEQPTLLQRSMTRASIVKTLETLTEQYPNLRVGQILANAFAGDMYSVTDAELLAALYHLQAIYGQAKTALREKR